MGKTDLGKWMITNGGEYSADATYEQLTMVKYGNSTYITLKTVTGIAPTDDKINYQLMAQGFDATALSAVQAEDTQGLCGEKGEIVTAQSLVDALADKVINTVMAKIGTAALTGGMTDLSSGVNSLYSNLAGKAFRKRGTYVNGDTVIDISAWPVCTLLSGSTFSDNTGFLYMIRRESASKIFCICMISSTATTVTKSSENKIKISHSLAHGGAWAAFY